MIIYCIDGPRKGRAYEFPAGTQVFQILSLVPGDVDEAYYGGYTSRYGAYIYKVVTMWGTRILVGTFVRLAYK
jgi:hypothetical protein